MTPGLCIYKVAVVARGETWHCVMDVRLNKTTFSLVVDEEISISSNKIFTLGFCSPNVP